MAAAWTHGSVDAELRPGVGTRVSIAIVPADTTGNHVFIGTTGGGGWASQNAAASSNVVFSPLTDPSSPFDSLRYGSISIGALAVQPGGTGVVLAGTGDPNDALDSYYGAGILRSIDGGSTWIAIPFTVDQAYSFMGEGFAGFAWSTTNPRVVVAAVSQSYEGMLVSAPHQTKSYAGLYYSTDAGATWSLASITDGAGKDVQGPLAAFVTPNGNSATAVIWNPIRQLFFAAVRFHGYYQSDAPFVENENCTGGTLNENQSCTIQVFFTPVDLGSASGNLSISANVPGGFRKRKRGLIVLMASLIGLASCAGSGGGGDGTPAPSNQNTPAGTYSIVVTATANGVSHKTTLTLIVD